MITGFNYGELSPLVEARTDAEYYWKGCRQMENFLVQFPGVATFRPGMYYVADGKTATAVIRLVSFVYGATSGRISYVLEFGNLYMRIFKGGSFSGEQIESGGSPVEVVTPYTTAQLFDLQFAQTATTLYIAHPSHKPRKLTRSSDTSWTLANWVPTSGSDPFTSANNYPGCVAIHQQRLVWGRTNSAVQALWMTQFGDFDSMTVSGTILATDAIVGEEWGSEEYEEIKWLVSYRGNLVIGSDSGEAMLAGQIDATNLGGIQYQRYSSKGSAGIQPRVAGSDLIFVQKGAKRFFNFRYAQETEGYEPQDVTLIADHITGDGVTQIAYQRNPFPIIWAVRDDGVLIGHTYDMTSGISGWFKVVTDGVVESVTVVPAAPEDEVWVSVQRTLDGTTKRTVEYMKPIVFDEQKDGYHLDCGYTFDGGDAVTGTMTAANPVVVTATAHGFSDNDYVRITGCTEMTELNNRVFQITYIGANSFSLDGEDGTGYDAETTGGSIEQVKKTITASHLANETVQVVADGAVHQDVTADASGNITLSRYANVIHAGISYEGYIQPMKISYRGKVKRVNQLTLSLYRALGGQVGPDEDTLQTIIYRTGSDLMGNPPALFSGDKTVDFRGNYEEDGNILIKQHQPLPMTVLGINPEFKVEGGR